VYESSERKGAAAATADRQEDEARLMARIAAGDLRAFERLYKAYHPRLSRFLTLLLGRPHLVDEVLNDTMMALWRKPDGWSGRSRLSTFIFAIAYRKAGKALKGLDEPVDDAAMAGLASEDITADVAFNREETRQRLMQALADLSPEHRGVVDLTYFQDFDYREIAEIMECPVETVKTRMFHARRRLKILMGGGLLDWL
jgi:RNA polymerase sigma-70 factor (ECF subfamily)